nr:MAG TPA: hypothetical protein [Caudoviricetes sp.]
MQKPKKCCMANSPIGCSLPKKPRQEPKKEELARKRALADKKARDILKISDTKWKTKVGGITRASVSVRGVKEYDEPIVLPMVKEWLIVTRADIPTCPFRTDNEQYATKRFERSVSSKWCDKPFYDEVRLYHNGAVVRAAVLGYEIIL